MRRKWLKVELVLKNERNSCYRRLWTCFLLNDSMLMQMLHHPDKTEINDFFFVFFLFFPNFIFIRQFPLSALFSNILHSINSRITVIRLFAPNYLHCFLNVLTGFSLSEWYFVLEQMFLCFLSASESHWTNIKWSICPWITGKHFNLKIRIVLYFRQRTLIRF